MGTTMKFGWLLRSVLTNSAIRRNAPVFRIVSAPSQTIFSWKGRSSEELLLSSSSYLSYRGPSFGRNLTSAAISASSSTAQDGEAILLLSDSCIKRLKALQNESPGSKVLLRITVDGGGCSGFQYNFKLDHKVNPDDRLFERDGAKVIVDETSLEYCKGSTVDFTQELIRSSFRVVSNPKAEHGCSCGSSFSVKI